VGFALTGTTNQTKSDPLQERNQTFSDFINRTDQLAHRLGKNVSEIPEILGISKSMLFAYRAGKNPITAKVWAKLEDAERIGSEKSEFVRSYANPNESTIPNEDAYSSKVSDDVAEYKYTPRPPPSNPGSQKIVLMEQTIDGMMAQLQLMKEMLQAMKTEQ
jgi:predicted transcriptional regulator